MRERPQAQLLLRDLPQPRQPVRLDAILGSFLGAAFIILLPIFLSVLFGVASHTFGLDISHSIVSNLELIIFGGLIIFFLIVEPHGLARLWQIAKEKLRLWPFPH